MRRSVEAAGVIEAATKAIGEVLAPEIATHLRAISFKQGTLKISSDRSAYSASARLHQEELIERTNMLLGNTIIERLHID